MAERVLVIGGTREATALAAELYRDGVDVVTSLAGRTREPLPVAGRVRSGGFGGIEGLVVYLRAERIDRVVDASHPFAANITRNVRAACERTGVPLQVRVRPPWAPVAGDRWIDVPDIAGAAAALPSGARALLALGSQHIAPFAARADVHFVVRMVDPPPAPLALPDHVLVLGRPSTDTAAEVALMRAYGLDHVVSRNSGGPGAYAKIAAARTLGLPVVMIARPL